MKHTKVLVLCGSIRAHKDNYQHIYDLVNKSKDIPTYQEAFLASKNNINNFCNSEIISGAALVGAKQAGAKIKYFSLMDLFPKNKIAKNISCFDSSVDQLNNLDTLGIDSINLEKLLSLLNWSNGIVLSTPVYFGDRSSVANKILQISSVRTRILNKIYGVVSVGAKRNGGQETCNIYSLYEMLAHGALGVGNGMPTSQYGGTAIGGDKGSVIEDNWGLRTAFGTGERVAQTAQLFTAGIDSSTKNKLKITFLITMDTLTGDLSNHIKLLAKSIEDKRSEINVRVVNISDQPIYRCLGCNVCPQKKMGRTAKCAIDDALPELIETSFNDVDGFIVCGVNPKNFENLTTRYQVFTERLRCIRRNDFQLSNKLVAGLCYHEFGATINPIHSLKVMTSYIRHNTIIHRPIEIFNHNGMLLNTGETNLLSFCKAVSLLAHGKRQISIPEYTYTPYGEGGGYNEF